MAKQTTHTARALWNFDRRFVGKGGLIGVDEAGRGAFAGPVMAAAVWMSPKVYTKAFEPELFGQLNDGKRLSPKQRAIGFEQLRTAAAAGQLHYTIASASVAEVDRLNVFQATQLAMRRALKALETKGLRLTKGSRRSKVSLSENPSAAQKVMDAQGDSIENKPQGKFTQGDFIQNDSIRGDFAKNNSAKNNSAEDNSSQDASFKPQSQSPLLWIDGLPLRNFPYCHEGLISGDARSLAIAAASVIAKFKRDKYMCELHEQGGPLLARYGLHQHKGYGTVMHRKAIQRFGASSVHRATFLKNL